MKPPFCHVCQRPLALSTAAGARDEGLVRFADYAPLPDGLAGHPQGLEWFCDRHVDATNRVAHLPFAEAMAAAFGR